MSFYQWIIKQTDRDDPVGDLANDIMDDSSFPKDGSYKSIYSHLVLVGACRECLDAFNMAMKEYDPAVETYEDEEECE